MHSLLARPGAVLSRGPIEWWGGGGVQTTQQVVGVVVGGIRLQSAAFLEPVRDAVDDPAQQNGYVVVGGRIEAQEVGPRFRILAGPADGYAVGDEPVQVPIELERRRESLHEGDGAVGVGAGEAQAHPARAPSLPYCAIRSCLPAEGIGSSSRLLKRTVGPP